MGRARSGVNILPIICLEQKKHDYSMSLQNIHPWDKVGITGRNDIGFLFWLTNEADTLDYNLGSRLKTPVLPIWVTCINDNWGVLFNPNKDLMKSYSAENRFHLFYYSSRVSVLNPKEVKNPKDTLLIIDTRGVKVTSELGEFDDDLEDIEDDPLASAIQTKYKNPKINSRLILRHRWEGAAVSWDGLAPYI